MWDLFIHEFCSRETYGPSEAIDLEVMAACRRRAALAAYCQQVALQCYGDVPLVNTAVLKKEAPSSNHQVYHIFSVAASDPSYPRTLQRGPLTQACPWLDPDASISERHSIWIRDDGDDLAGWPEYLWDTEKRCAVRTGSLDEKPTYIAISHAWGRWSDQNDGYTLPSTPDDLRYPGPSQ